MGYPHPETIKPLVELKELIEERTGVKPGTTGGMFRLNPFVEDIPEKYAVDIDGVKVLVAGAVKKGGSGCYCPENTMIRSLISHLLTEKNSALVLDMEAGIEHLSRGTIAAVDHLIIVTEPGRRSIETAERIAHMAAEIGLNRVSVIGNKIRSEQRQGLPQGNPARHAFYRFPPLRSGGSRRRDRGETRRCGQCGDGCAGRGSDSEIGRKNTVRY